MMVLSFKFTSAHVSAFEDFGRQPTSAVNSVRSVK